MAIAASKGHVVAFVMSAWGHNKPLVAFFAKLVRLSHAHVTFFTGASMYDRVLREVKKQFLPEGEETLMSLIRVVSLPESPIPFELEDLRKAFNEAYKALWAGLPIPATPEGLQMHEAVGRPQLVLLDFFLYEAMNPIREISGNKVPIYTWQSGSTSGVTFLFGPEHLGGNGDLAKKIEKITTVDENERYEEGQKIYHRIKGELLKIPSLPPMYDYEFSPQNLIIPIDVAKHCQYVHRMLVESDGSIHCTNPAYEGESLKAWAEWLPNAPTFAVGPVATPPELARIHDTKEPSDVEIEIEAFLTNAANKYGENSVFFISFGTVFWSTEPEKIWTVLDVLMELKIPFMFAHASPFANIPDEIKQKVADSGLGYMSNWLPQQMILNHRACGWFLSHGGQNSTTESLSAGVPIIFWPFEADQPMNAALVSVIHEAGYELIEARQGLSLQPMHRLGGRAPEGTVEALRKEAIEIFMRARGEDGKVRRMNAQRLGKQFTNYWAPDGAGWKELQRIVDVLH